MYWDTRCIEDMMYVQRANPMGEDVSTKKKSYGVKKEQSYGDMTHVQRTNLMGTKGACTMSGQVLVHVHKSSGEK